VSGHETGPPRYRGFRAGERRDILAGQELVADRFAEAVADRRIDDLPEAAGERVDEPLGPVPFLSAPSG
jgi:hypothetical protein